MDGIIVINKEKGYTSHDVVAKLKKKLNISKVGHTGTLDPNATGVLPILIGKGTKFSKYLINHDKIYDAQIELGKKTDTADIEGKIIEEKNVDTEYIKQNLAKVLEGFIGKQEQIPPMYSAIKKNGKKLYEYARKGEKVEIQPRNIEIYNLDLININEKEQQITLRVSCSKGTYIRSLCEDIAKSLNTVGYMLNLNRIKVDRFDISKSVTLQQIENSNNNYEFINKNIITVEELFDKKEEISLDDKKLKLFLNGVKLSINKKDDVYRIYLNTYQNKKFIGTGTIKNKILKRDIIC